MSNQSFAQVHRTWRGYSSSRSRSESPQPRCPPSPQVSSPPDTPLPPYSPSGGSQSPTSNQGGPPIVRSKTRDLPSILVMDTPQWKTRFKKVPDLHKRFLMEVCSVIVNTAELAQFAKGCEISDYTISRVAMDNLGNDGECIEQALCRWWMSSNTHPHHKAHKVKLGFDQLDCPGLFGTLLDRYHELDPRGDEAVTVVELLPGPPKDPSYDGDNGKKLDMDSHLWREECFHEVEEKLDRGITTLIMNLATLVTKMDDLKDLADSMHLPRRIATLLATTYKLVMVTMLQMYTLCSYHMLRWVMSFENCITSRKYLISWALAQNVQTLCHAMAMVL